MSGVKGVLSDEEKRRLLTEVGTMDESVAKGIDRLSSFGDSLRLMSNIDKKEVAKIALGLNVGSSVAGVGVDLPWLTDYFLNYLALLVSVKARGRDDVRDVCRGQMEKARSMRERVGDFIGGGGGGV